MAQNIIADQKSKDNMTVEEMLNKKGLSIKMVAEIAIRKKLIHIDTGKQINKVQIKWKGAFVWNSTYHVYNNEKNFDQLTIGDLNKIDWKKTK